MIRYSSVKMLTKSLLACLLAAACVLSKYQINANSRYAYESDSNTDAASSPGLALGESQYQLPAPASHHHLRHHHRQPSKTIWSILDQTVKSNELADNKRQKEQKEQQLVQQQQHEKHRRDRKNQSNCPKCKNELLMTEDELTELRIEYVKKQILKKLKLKERPQVSVSHIPRPVAEGATIQLDDNDDMQSRVSEEFYAKTTQKIIFPQLGMSYCIIYTSHLAC